MGIALADNVRQLLDRPNFAHLATLMEDGSPLSTPVWVGREGDRLIVCTSGKSLKARNTQRDPRVALSIQFSTLCCSCWLGMSRADRACATIVRMLR